MIAEFTEIWAPTPIGPLIRFADAVYPLSSTGIDLVGVGDLEISGNLKQRLQSFDSIVSWYGANRPEFRELLLRIGAHCEFHAALPPRDSQEHAIDFFARQARAPEGLVPRIDVGPITDRGAVVIHPFSGSARKNWALDRYRELARQLRLPVEWTAGPEEELPEAVRFTNLAELAVWIRGARLYIGNDSGITHLAAATGVRTLALFGAASRASWAPRGDNVTVACAESLEKLEVQAVANVANRLLDSR